MPNDAERAFENAVLTLNSYNLTDLWAFCSLLSMLDFFGGDEHHEQYSPFFPFINSEQLRLLATTVLYSRAADYKQPRDFYDHQQYVRTHNALTNVLGPGNISAVSTLEELEIKFFAPVANRQFPSQTRGKILSRLARNYALMVVIPRKHSVEIQQTVNNAGLSFDMTAELQHTYGLSLECFLQLAFSVVALYLQRNQSVGVSEKAKAHVRLTRAPLPVLEAYLQETQSRRSEVQFVPSDLAVVASSTEIEGFLRLVANTTRELRGALTRPEYQRGPIGLRVTPLERYPVIDLGQGRFVVPDLPTYVAAVADIPHLAMFGPQHSANRDAYRSQQGAAQEVYLRELVKTRLPGLTVIPELEYRHQGRTFKGPDLTLLEADGKVVLVESKARRIQMETRVEQDVEAMLRNLGGVLDAFEKLVLKWEHLREGVGGYQPHQATFLATPDTPIAVGVIGETHYFANEKLRYHVQRTPGHFLASYPFPYLILSVEQFEEFVEIAATNGLSLYALLGEQYELSRSGRPNAPQGVPAQYGQSQKDAYISRYLDELLDQLMPS